MMGVEVTDAVLAELGYKFPARQLFVKGPLPLDWLVRVDVVPSSLLLALAIKMIADMRTGPVCLSKGLSGRLGLSRDKRRRAIDALENAGIIRTERLPGRAVQIWLIDDPKRRGGMPARNTGLEWSSPPL
jgi:hypothetical protein